MPYFGEEVQPGTNNRRLLGPKTKEELFCHDEGFGKFCMSTSVCGKKAKNVAKTCAGVKSLRLCRFNQVKNACCAACQSSASPRCELLKAKSWQGDDASTPAASRFSGSTSPVDCNTKCNNLPACEFWRWTGAVSQLCYLMKFKKPITKTAAPRNMLSGKRCASIQTPVAICENNEKLLSANCDAPMFRTCGYGSKNGPKDCAAAKAAGWCEKRKTMMDKYCPETCGSCQTCEDLKCPDGYTQKTTTKKSKNLAPDNCCVKTEDICSCEWKCMLDDSCCDDFSKLCCK